MQHDVTTDFISFPRNNDIHLKIQPANLLAHDKICRYLDTKQFFYYTFVPKSKRTKCFIIKGITTKFGFTSDDTRLELITKGLPTNTIIKTFQSGTMRVNNEYALFKVILPIGTDERIFKGIKQLYNVGVHFEKFQSNKTPQCNKCQRYFHSAGGCAHQYRCVKCVEYHEPGKCAKITSQQPQCINCKGFHTGNNNNECTYYQQKIKKIVEDRKKRIVGKIPSLPSSMTNHDKKMEHSYRNTSLYSIYRNDRAIGNGGGVAIAIKSDIKHKKPKSFSNSCFEAIALDICFTDGPITIISYYGLNNTTITDFEYFKKLMKSIHNKRFIYVGDFNARLPHLHRFPNRVGKELGVFAASNSSRLLCLPSDQPAIEIHLAHSSTLL